MAPIYRDCLPQLARRPFLTDGGIETTLIFHDGLDLPEFAAFTLHADAGGEAALMRYFQAYTAVAERFGVGIVLESATWRASGDWGRRLGYDGRELARVNTRAIDFLSRMRGGEAAEAIPLVISGCIGPRGDGYNPSSLMSVEEAEAYHFAQVQTFAASAADLVSALTMNYVEEAIGVTRAATRAAMPIVVSFTVETDGALATGQPLAAAIEQVDAATDRWPAYYMINCAHPSHFEHVLTPGAPWCDRVGGIRANASAKSHAELNESPTLDIGDPEELAHDYARILQHLPRVAVLGGCCGTDHRHIERIAAVCFPLLGAGR